MAGEAREADDLALARDEFAARPVCRCGAHAHPDRRVSPRAAAAAASRAAQASLSTPPIAATSFARLKLLRRVFGDDLAVAHHDDAVAGLQHFAENVRDEHAADAGSTERRT